MKLLDILAKELKVWPESFGEFCISTIVEGSYAAWFNDRKPSRITNGGWSDIGCVELWISTLPDDHTFAIVTREQWQYAVDALNDPAWNGEGLPPVGTVCERNRLGTWILTTICGYSPDGKSYAAFFDDDSCGWIAPNFLRPIRTAEQIAADERLHKVRNALTTIKASRHFPGDEARQNVMVATVEAMIDAGFVQQVVP